MSNKKNDKRMGMTPEELKERQEYAKVTLKSNHIKSIVASKYLQENGGNICKGYLDSAIAQNAPSESDWQNFYAPFLMEGQQGLNSNFISNLMEKQYMENLAVFSVGEVLKMTGYEGKIDEKYNDKLVGEINGSMQLISANINSMSLDYLAKTGVPSMKKAMNKNLESIFAPKEEKQKAA